MNVIFDIIYYIYPPLATKLASTRKSTWLNPVVGEEDALRLRGFFYFGCLFYFSNFRFLHQKFTNQKKVSSWWNRQVLRKSGD